VRKYQNCVGYTALMLAMYNGDVNIAKQIILKDATTLDQIDNRNLTPLMIAINNEDEEMVQFLIDQNANLKYRHVDGYTALMLAMDNGDINIAKQIILKDATTLDQVNNENLTLMIAVIQGNEEMVQFLIDQNANVKYQNIYGDTALMMAVRDLNVNIAKQIILKDTTTLDQVNKDNKTPLMIAVLQGNEEMVQFLIDQNANVKYQRIDGYTTTALMIVMYTGDVNIAKQIILKDATTLDQIDFKNRTPLMRAIVYKNEEIVQFLIDQNANVKYQNEDGDTALMIAVRDRNVNIAKQIILKDATTLDQVNKDNKTPLDIAKMQKDATTLDQVNKNKKTPLGIAKMQKDADMITLVKTFQMQPEKTFCQEQRICKEKKLCCAKKTETIIMRK